MKIALQLRLRHLMFALLISLTFFQPQAVQAQCGAAANIKPTVSTTNICSGNYVYVFATGLPVARWVFRDNNTGGWNTYNSASDNMSYYMSASVPTVRTFRAVLTTAACANDTTAGIDVNIVPPSFGTNNSIKLSSSNYNTCGGSNVTVRLMNPSYQTTQWIYRDNGSNWIIYSSGNSQSYNMTLPSVTANTVREYRVLVLNQQNCRQDSSDIVAINISPSIAGTNKNYKPILSNQTICGGTYTYATLDWPLQYGNWIYKDANSSTWQVYTANTATAYDYNTNVISSTTRSYKAILLNPNTCSADTSDEAILTINASGRRNLTDVKPKITGTTVNICAGNYQYFQLQGYGSVNWYYRDSANANWISASSGTSISIYANTNITKPVQREVRAVINNSTAFCSYDTTASVFYTIKPFTYGNTTQAQPYVSSTEFCSGSTIQAYMSNGYTINNWFYRDNNNGKWIGLGSMSTLNDNNTNLTTTTLRSYRLQITNNIACSYDTSAEVQVTIKPPVVGSVLAVTPTTDQKAYCSGSGVYGSINLGTGFSVSKWIYRDNNTGNWIDLPFQTSSSFSDNNTSNLTSPTKRSYRVLIRNLELFRIDTSLEVAININPLTRGNINVAPYNTQNILCNQNSTTINIVIPGGYSVYTWLGRELSTQNWSTFGSSSTSTSDYISSNNPSKTYRTLLFNASNCRYDTTNAITLPILQRTGRNNSAIMPIAANTSVCSGTSFSVSNSVAPGTSIQKWMWRDNNGAWKDINTSSTSYSESSNGTRVLEPTQRNYRVLINDNNNCSVDTSAFVTVNISPLMNGATSNITPVSTNSIYCSGTSYQVYLNNYSGTVQKWVYRDNNGPWTEFNSSTQSTYLYESYSNVSTNTQRDYRAFLVRSNTCSIDTTQILKIQINPYTYGNAPAVQPISNLPTVCTGNNLTVQLNNYSGSVHKWIYRNAPTTEWREIDNSSGSSNYTESNINVINNTVRQYRSILLTTGCSFDTTAMVSVQVSARTNGSAPNMIVTSSTGIFCSSSTVSVNLATSLPSGSSVKKWLYMDNQNGSWTDIVSSSSSLNQTGVSVNVPTTRSYRVIINNNNSCSYDSSSAYSVTINPSTKGYVSINPSINLTSFCTSTSTVPYMTLSGYSGTILKWVMNTNNQGWTDFAYTTASSNIYDYNTNVMGQVSRAYRAIINNPTTCSIDSTNAVTVSISPLLYGNNNLTPTGSRTVSCYTKPIVANMGTIPSGYSISKWIYSNNNGAWTDFPSSTTSSTLTDNNTWVSQSIGRSYRVVMTNTSSCRMDTTAAYSVLINARSNNIGSRNVQPTVSKASICSGASITISAAPGNGNELIRWTYSDNGPSGPWYNAYNSYNQTSFAHNSTYVLNDITRLYRAIITDTSTCDFDSTLAVPLSIKSLKYGKDTSLSISGLDTICAGSTLSLNVSPGSGNSVVKWLYNINAGPWQDFTSSTASVNLSDNNTLFAPGTTKYYTNIVLKGTTCSNDTLTKSKPVYIKNKTYGNSLTQTSVTSTDTVCSGNTVSAFTSGTIERWLFRDGKAGVWQVIPNSTSSSLSHTNTVVPASLWRYYRAVINTGSCNADTSNMDSVYLRLYQGGLISISPTTTTPNICSGNTIALSLSVSNATIQRWLYRDNNGVWNTLSTTSSSSLSDNNTYLGNITSREYKVILLKNCSYDTTNTLTVTISPKIAGTDLTKIPTVASATVCAASAVTNISVTAGSGNTIMQWLYRDNNGVWKVLSNGNSSGLSDNNTYVGSQVIRDYVAIINNNTTCRYDTTAKVTVTINPVVLGNSSRTPVTPAISCMGSNYNVSMSVASDTTILRFLYNSNGGAWNDKGYITPTTSYNYSEFANTSSSPYTMGYRAVLYKAGNCHIDTTAAAYVNIGTRTYGSDPSINPSSTASVCSNNSYSVSISAGSGNTIQNWLISDNNNAWTPYYTTSTSISGQVATQTIVTRRFRALVIKSNACSIDSSNIATTTINPLVYGLDTVAKTTISGNKGICTGATITVNTSGVSGTINNWLYRNDYASPWYYLYQSGSSINDVNTNTAQPINRQYALLLYKSSSCRIDTTVKNDTAFISNRVYGNDSNFTITSSNTNLCVGTSILLSAAGIGSNTIQQWLYSDNASSWNNLLYASSTSVTDYNTNFSQSTQRRYRLVVRKNTVCSIDSGKVFTVNFNSQANGTYNAVTPVLANASVCSGSVVNVTVNPGSGNTVIKWLYNSNNTGWTEWANTSSTSMNDYNTTTASLISRQYKAIINRPGNCSNDTTAGVTVSINPLGYGNQNTVAPQTNATSVCSGTPIALNISGFSGSTVRYWLTRDNNDPWSIINTTSTSYVDFSTGTNTLVSRQYAVLVVNASGCSFDTTGITTVLINPITSSVLATSAQATQASVCNGSPINVFINTPSGYSIKQWLFRNSGDVWQVLNVGNSASVNDFNTAITTNTTREYRVLLNNTSGCSIDSSGSASVNINLITQGTNLSVVPFSSTPVICSGNNAMAGISGFSGTVIQWLYRDSAIYPWNTINSNGFTLYHSSTFVSYTRVREYRALLYNANQCSYDTSAAVQITINPQLQGNANAVLPTSANSTYCSGTQIGLNAAGFINGGTVTGWLFSDNNGPWIPILSSATPNLNHSNTVVTVFTTRKYRALVLTGCVTDSTAALEVTIDLYPNKPTVQRSGLSDTLNCSTVAASYQWKLNGNDIAGATSKQFIATQNGNYTVQTSTSTGCKSLSDVLVFVKNGIEENWLKNEIKIYPNPSADGIFTADIPHLSFEQMQISVSDIYGRIITSNNFSNQQKMLVDLSDAPSGVYLMTFTTSGISVTRRVVLSK